jgi:hypothetical protein
LRWWPVPRSPQPAASWRGRRSATTRSRPSPSCEASRRSRSRPTSRAPWPARRCDRQARPPEPRKVWWTPSNAWLALSYSCTTRPACASTYICRSATCRAHGRSQRALARSRRATPRRAGRGPPLSAGEFERVHERQIHGSGAMITLGRGDRRDPARRATPPLVRAARAEAHRSPRLTTTGERRCAC